MYKASAYDPRLDRFLDQFEADGDDWLYRYKKTGAAYRVTEAEREAFLAAFDRQRRQLFWIRLAIVGGLAIIGLPSLWLGSHSPFKDMNPFWGSLIIGVSLLVDHLFGYRVPEHAFDGRAPVAPALSLTERRRLALERLPLTVVVGTATVTFVLLLYFALERPPIGSVGLAVIIASVAALVWAIVQGMRKWQLERAYAASNLI